MIFGYRDGKIISNEEMLIMAEGVKIEDIKINGELMSLACVPYIKTPWETVHYLHHGMTLYLVEERNANSMAYVIEQEIRNGKMQIKHIDSYMTINDDEPLLRYCAPEKTNEAKNIALGVDEILRKIEFIDAKERAYLITKIQEFFEPKAEEKPKARIVKRKGVKGPRARLWKYKDVLMTLKEISEATGMAYQTLTKRISKGMTLEEAISTPVKERRR